MREGEEAADMKALLEMDKAQWHGGMAQKGEWRLKGLMRRGIGLKWTLGIGMDAEEAEGQVMANQSQMKQPYI